MKDADDHPLLSGTLRNLSEEMSRISLELRGVEEHAFNLAQQLPGELTAEIVSALQGFDRIDQNLVLISGFVKDLSDPQIRSDPEAIALSVDRITLADLANALRCSRTSPVPIAGQSTGAELF